MVWSPAVRRIGLLNAAFGFGHPLLLPLEICPNLLLKILQLDR